MRRVLLDHSVPRPVVRILSAHVVVRAYERGWQALKNGELLAAVEGAGFEVFVTADQNLRYQQNLQATRLAIVVIGTNIWPVIAADPLPIARAVASAQPGAVAVVPYPKAPRLRGPQP
ncbi:MAG: hypothetical protein BGO51_25885 [Rhodospirillales bacterium 69-11]|nr:hypothetical protein [Rhodospirillales bacterium]MBN8929691.1 hypothetical protein [Rhodospirillales bacterium]OJW20926.1 MAG: hypothetical protein BGO51_25885 [Rhodospirillales bacterium 69-11]